jgi:hypothetical protein
MEHIGLHFGKRDVVAGLDTVFYETTRDQWTRRNEGTPDEKGARIR